MNKSLKIFFILNSIINLCNTNILGQLKLTEIMFAPSAGNSEFIEFINTSETDNVDLSGVKIKYYTAAPDEIISLSGEYLLKPNQYAIVLEADYDLEEGIYKNLIPNDALIFKLDDNAYGSTGMSNSSDRKIYLMNSENDTIDSYSYSADNSNGYSDERIGFINDKWKNSNILNGTPGFINSVSLKENDVNIEAVNLVFTNSNIGDSIKVEVKIKNSGLMENEFSIQLYDDLDNDKLYDNLLEESKSYILESNDSIFHSFNYTIIFRETEQQYLIRLNISDNDSTNNYKWFIIYPGYEKSTLVINEIMYSPINDEPEWIELFNRSEKNISILNYFIFDENTGIEIKRSIEVKSKEYYVLADDSSFFDIYPNVENADILKLPSLNNSKDQIILKDSLKRIIDSVEYYMEWGGSNGNSLERIDAELISVEKNNWGESKYPTPGLINSISKKNKDLMIDSFLITPINYIINDSVLISCKIKNIGKQDVEFTSELFVIDVNTQNKIFLERSNNIMLHESDSLVYDFKRKIVVSDTRKDYIILLNVEDDDSANNSLTFSLYPAYSRSTILVNEIMFVPHNDEPEWIEIYNNSDFTINLSNWMIGDVLTKPVFKEIINENYFIAPKSYLVITKDSSIFDYHKLIPSKILISNFSNLNNDADGIVIKDNRGITIDSVFYTNEYTKNGRSTERIDKNINSINSNNWSASLDIEGSTPGRVNSISHKNIDVALVSISALPINPIKDQLIGFKLLIKNYGEQTAENIKVDLFIDQMFFEEITIPQIGEYDSIYIETQNQILIKDTITVSAKAELMNDEDIVNNSIEKKIIAGFNQFTLLLNEIMIRTNSSNEQWIELYNNSDSTINLKNWLVSNGSQDLIITQSNFEIPSYEFVVIAEQNSQIIFDENINTIYTDLPNFNMDKDEVAVYDYRKVMIDSMKYDYNDEAKLNISLERINLQNESFDKSNWQNCLNSKGNTASEINSIANIPQNNFGDIIITEIMFNPSENNSEYMEIYNTKEIPIEIGGWKIKIDENFFPLSEYSSTFNSNTYFVLSSDSLIFQNYTWLQELENTKISNVSSLGFTNIGKTIYLIDNRNKTIDSITYSESWHNSAFLDVKNISLELININLQRTNPVNWSSCVNNFGGTPGKQNSIFIQNEPTRAKLKISPNPFSPDNDGHEDFSIISYNLKEPISQIRVRIYDSKGRKVRELENNVSVGSSGKIIFDGLDERKNPLKIGIYIILFEAVNTRNSVVELLKDVIVIARKF